MTAQRILFGMGAACLVVFLLGCDTLVPQESSVAQESSANPAAISDVGPISRSVAGTWLGTVHYSMPNGNSFDDIMTLVIDPAHRQVNMKVGNPEEQTVASEIIAAHRAGNGVGFSSSGSASVTEVILQPTSHGSAEVTSRVTGNGSVLATGAGAFKKQD